MVIRARRFELVDAAHRPWATLGFDAPGEVEFDLRNRDGRGELNLSFHEEEPKLLLFVAGNIRAACEVTRAGRRASSSMTAPAHANSK